MSEVHVVLEPQGLETLSKDHWREFHDHYPSFNLEYLKKAVCIQAFDGEKPVGYLFMYVFPEPYEKGIVGMIDLYYLDPRYRGKKISDRMFTMAENVAKRAGASRLAASANVLKPHDEFFKRLGFKKSHVCVSKVI
jgi:GNAT superfamily N-acetyltransferase